MLVALPDCPGPHKALYSCTVTPGHARTLSEGGSRCGSAVNTAGPATQAYVLMCTLTLYVRLEERCRRAEEQQRRMVVNSPTGYLPDLLG